MILKIFLYNFISQKIHNIINTNYSNCIIVKLNLIN